MKLTTIKILVIALGASLIATSCKKSDDATPAATVYYQQQDQMARPAINTVFIPAAHKDGFNTTVPSQQNATFGADITAGLTAFGYTTNILGWDKPTFSSALGTDVLTASTTGVTTFYDGVNVLTGRALTDDVIDVELTLIFGGAAGTSNPGLTSDHVNGNDKAFLTTFPYLATPF
jgi:hypothetical protein